MRNFNDGVYWRRDGKSRVKFVDSSDMRTPADNLTLVSVSRFNCRPCGAVYWSEEGRNNPCPKCNKHGGYCDIFNVIVTEENWNNFVDSS